MSEVPRPRFLGVGVGHYANGLTTLPAAVREIQTLRSLLDDQVDGVLLSDPSEARVRQQIDAMIEPPDPRPLILAWSGHASVIDDELRVLAADSSRRPSGGLSLREIVLSLSDSGTSQLLIIIDVCAAGTGVPTVLKAALSVYDRRGRSEQPLWIGALASCRPAEAAVDGVFGRRLRRLIRDGPRDGQSRLTWSPDVEYLSGDAIGDAMQAVGNIGPAQQVRYAKAGLATRLIRNPRFKRPDFPAVRTRPVDQVMAGTAPEAPHDEAAVSAVTSWIDRGEPGLYVLSGPPGSGKSAALAGIVNGSTHVEAALNVRGRTAEQVRSDLAGEPAVVVVDGLDEAGEEAAAIAATVLVPLAVRACVVIAVRTPQELLPPPAGQVELSPRRPSVPPRFDRAGSSGRTLPAGVTSAQLARHILTALDWSYGPGFGEAEWIVAADATAPPGVTIDRDDVLRALDQFGAYVVRDVTAGVAGYRPAHAPPRIQPVDNPKATAVAAALLNRWRSLIDHGLPADESPYLWQYGWRHAVDGGDTTLAALREMADAVPALRSRVTMAERAWAGRLNAAGRPGAAVLHLERAVDYADDPAARARALNNLAVAYRGAGRPAAGAVAAYRAAELFRVANDRDPLAAGDLPGALTNLAVAWADSGQGLLATSAAVEALSLCRDPADRAMALNNLGTAYRAAGRPEDAYRAAAASVDAYERAGLHDGAAANAYLNLAVRLDERDRPAEAVGMAERAVALLEPMASDPAQAPHLAVALVQLARGRLVLGRAPDAAGAADRATALFRDTAGGRPWFRSHHVRAWIVLSAAQLADGRAGEAGAAAERAVDLADGDDRSRGEALDQLARIRYAAGDGPGAVAAWEGVVGLPGATDLTWRNLSEAYRLADRPEEAVDAVTEAIELLSTVEPAARRATRLAGALTTLALAERDLDRPADATEQLIQAVRLTRRSDADEAGRRALAAVLDRLVSVGSESAGHADDVRRAAEEAVRLHRSLGDRPALVAALVRCAAARSRAGEPATALESALRAAALQPQGPGQPAGERILRAAVDQTLGVIRAEVGDAAAVDDLAAAVAAYESLLPGHPELLPDLADALTAYERLPGAGVAAEASWVRLDAADPVGARLARLSAAPAGDPRAPGWLATLDERSGLSRHDTFVLHTEARRHRAADPAAFRRLWPDAPAWSAIDGTLVAAALAWTAVPASTYLAAHPELLSPAAEPAVREALLSRPPERAEQLKELWSEAVRLGPDVARRRRRRALLAARFTAGTLTERRRLLVRERADLLDPRFRESVTEDTMGAALLGAAAAGVDGPVIDALASEDPEHALAALMAAHATDPVLGPVAEVAARAATTPAARRAATFYAALAAAVSGRRPDVDELRRRTRGAGREELVGLLRAGLRAGDGRPAVTAVLSALVG